MSVLISVRPEWCEKIASGKKTIEVRKTAPKEVPFKAYIYCTKGKDGYEWLYRVDNNGYGKAQSWHGKVIGEFICNKIYNIEPIFSFYDCYSGYADVSDFSCFEDYSIDEERLKKTCLTRRDLYIYGGEKTLYGWHISDLKIYDKPKELNRFVLEKPKNSCDGCGIANHFFDGNGDCNLSECDGYHIRRPPQSYMFVEEVKE